VSAIVVGGLVVMWVVVLVPMWLRRHDEVEETRSVDKFNSAMHTLSRREPEPARKYGVKTHRSRPVEVHVSGASADGTPQRRVSATERRDQRLAGRPVVSPAARRRRALIGLLVTVVLTVMLAVVVGGLLLWALQIVADLCLVGFVMHLRSGAGQARGVAPARQRPAAAAKRTTTTAAQRRAAPSRPVRVARPAPLAEPEFDDVRRFDWSEAPLATRASELEPLFDQTAEFERVTEFEETVELDQIIRHDVVARDATAAVAYRLNDVAFDDTSFDRSASEAPVFDRTMADSVKFDRTASEGAVFDRNDFDDTAEIEAVEAVVPEVVEYPTEPIHAPVAPEPVRQVARTQRPARPRRSAPVERPEPSEPTEWVAAYEPVAPADADSGIGERPWEPVPVPRPVYATKPKAPKRRDRAPVMEPTLPPVETAAELDPVDDLEEILDRRWAVND
jgi:hypothetical protein